MKTFSHHIHQQGRSRIGLFTLVIAASLLLSVSSAHARRVYGVSTSHGNYAAAAGPRGVAVAGPNGFAAASRPVGYGGGYMRTLPAGYRPAYYGGYNCYYAGGVYYRPQFYQGTTVYVVVP